MAMKDSPSTQRSTCGPSTVVTHVPRAPASAWLASVATRIPSTMGQGLRKRVETRKASMMWSIAKNSAGRFRTALTAPRLRPDGSVRSQWSRPARRCGGPHAPWRPRAPSLLMHASSRAHPASRHRAHAGQATPHGRRRFYPPPVASGAENAPEKIPPQIP